jgi:hypothetical protein
LIWRAVFSFYRSFAIESGNMTNGLADNNALRD